MALLAPAFAAAVTIVAALVPPLHVPGMPDSQAPPAYPAPAGYLLPWPGGQIHSVTQGEETPFTHNGFAAYAFDFDLDYETVVAARSGKVAMVEESSNSGGCDPSFSASTNYVVIDHGDGTSGLYMHLAYQGVQVKPGDIVRQGQPIALSGETGVTCASDDAGPGPHLHFQVERTEDGHYFTQSLPIAFDDIGTNDGVSVEGQSYVSGNFGSGQPQRIKLTPHRAPRVFNPVARPLNPALMEAPLPPPEAPTATPTTTPTPTPTPPNTLTPSSTPTRTPLPTGTAAPTDTPSPTNTATPTPTSTSTPSPTAALQPTSTSEPMRSAISAPAGAPSAVSTTGPPG